LATHHAAHPPHPHPPFSPYTTLFRSNHEESCPPKIEHPCCKPPRCVRSPPGGRRTGMFPPNRNQIPRTMKKRHPLVPSGTIHAADRKSTRLNSSHVKISYAVCCLKKK